MDFPFETILKDVRRINKYHKMKMAKNYSKIIDWFCVGKHSTRNNTRVVCQEAYCMLLIVQNKIGIIRSLCIPLPGSAKDIFQNKNFFSISDKIKFLPSICLLISYKIFKLHSQKWSLLRNFSFEFFVVSTFLASLSNMIKLKIISKNAAAMTTFCPSQVRCLIAALPIKAV